MKYNDPLHHQKFKRGSQLPQSKLTEDDVKLIWCLIHERNELKKKASNLTNEKIAAKFNVHRRTIERITEKGGWNHVNSHRSSNNR